MAGRFTLLTDEHIDNALVIALRARGWEVVRIVDHPALGQQTSDDAVFAYAAEHDWVWLTRDERATWRPGKWLQEGKRFRGMLCWPGISVNWRRTRGPRVASVNRKIASVARSSSVCATMGTPHSCWARKVGDALDRSPRRFQLNAMMIGRQAIWLH